MGKKHRKRGRVERADPGVSYIPTQGPHLPGPYLLNDGWLPSGSALNFWQMGDNLRQYEDGSAIVEACVAAYAQTVAMCPGTHWWREPDGGRTRLENSALNRILIEPNDYQSISDCLMNLTRSLYSTGSAYALAIRNNRNEIQELHPMMSSRSRPYIGEDGSIFYSLGGNPIAERRFDLNRNIPARDVLHVRLATPVNPLMGVTPLLSAKLETAAGNAMFQQQLAFFLNQARPSIGLSTEQQLNKEQAAFLRQQWDEQTRGSGTGGTPILSAGLKPVFFDRPAKDAELAEILKLSVQSVALAFRVPLQVLGIAPAAVTSTEMLIGIWKSTGLGFALNHIEEAFGRLFRLKGYPNEYLELNTDALLRASFRDRIEGLARAVQGGIYSPNEARNAEDMPSVDGGEEPRVQQQVVPLSFGMKLEPTTPAPAPAPDPAPEDTPAADTPDSEADNASKHGTEDVIARIHAYAGTRLQ